MAKRTVALNRECECYRLVFLKTGDQSEIKDSDLREAQRLMTSLYRLCGLCERNVLMSSRKTRKTNLVKQSVEREQKWYERLKREFETFAPVTLVYYGYHPGVMRVENGEATGEAVSLYFY